MQLMKKLSALRKKATPHQIPAADGQMVEFKFYPVRVAKVATGELKELAEPLVNAFTLLLNGSRQHEVQVTEEVTEMGAVIRQNTAIAPELASLRDNQREVAIRRSMDVLLNEKARLAIGRLLMDSLRDDFEKATPTDEEVLAFIDHESMTLDVLAEFIKGFFAANTMIFGDLGNRIKGLVQGQVEQLLEQNTGNDSTSQSTSDPLTEQEAALRAEGEQEDQAQSTHSSTPSSS